MWFGHRFARRLCCALLAGALVIAGVDAPAAPLEQPSAGAIAKGLERLSVLGSVLYVAAHPDDENTALLTYLANGRQVRAAYLSMTRGDGGQNLIGAEQGIALGLIRTQELLAARRIDGAQQFFTRARDFGYSKSVEETLRIWGEDEILADVVEVVRRFQPDLIITRFPTDGGGGHGHHTASAQLAVRAFKLAADPSYQPAGAAKLPPWQARRLLWNNWSGGALKLDIGLYDARLGASYNEIAADSRSMYKSQGFGQQRRRGPQLEGFELLAEVPGSTGGGKSLDAGLDWTWARVAGGQRAAELAADAQRSFRAEDPAASIPKLVAFDAALDAVVDPLWRAEKRKEVAALIAACAGLFVEATAAAPAVVAGEKLAVTVNALNRSKAQLTLGELRFVGRALGAGETLAVGKALPAHEPQRWERTLTVAATAAPSGPYWLAEPPLPGRFALPDRSLAGLAENPPALAVEAHLSVGGRRFALAVPVRHKWTDPVAGERVRPVEVVPAVALAPDTNALLFADGKPRPLVVRVKGALATNGSVRLEAPPGYTVKPASAPFALEAPGDEVEVAFTVQAGRAAAPGTLRAIADVDAAGRRVSVAQRLQVIEYPHLPTLLLVTPAEVRVAPVALERAVKRIGYIAGAGDEVAASLEGVGYQVVPLDEAALRGGPLEGYDAIVTGVRAFNTNARLGQHHARLMKYVHGGGTLVVQYNTSNRLAKVSGRIGPLPFELGRDRVTDETAAVTFAQPTHAVLTWPNRLGPADFAGWVQERGLYFASTWDKGYAAPLAMADPGEAPLAGSLLVARHGKGAFIYTGLAFFRQLPAGVPGAYRLFANLIAHGHAPRP